MGDREFPSLNKFLTERRVAYEKKKQREALLRVTKSIDNVSPPSFVHLAHKAKKKQMDKERMRDVERENLILLDKMRKIMVEPRTLSAPPYIKDSLNRKIRKDEIIAIVAQNGHLLKRIQSRTSYYPTAKLLEDYAFQQKLLRNIAQRPPPKSAGSFPPLNRILMNKAAAEAANKAAEVIEESPPKKKRAIKKGCVFSEANINIHGVNSTLSVYDANTTHLEFIAVDQEGWSNKGPIVLSIQQLKERFEDQPNLLDPANTKDLVLVLLPDFFFIIADKNIILSYRKGGPLPSDPLADPQPLEAGDTVTGKFTLGDRETSYSVTETTGARQFWIVKLECNGQSHEHTVAVAEFSTLKRQMGSRCNLSFASFVSRKRKWAGELVTLFAPGADENQPPVFNGQPLRKFEEIAKEISPKKKSPKKKAAEITKTSTAEPKSSKTAFKKSRTAEDYADDFVSEKEEEAEEVIIDTEDVHQGVAS